MSQERYKLTERGRELVDTMTWGGARPGAGRPRTESLDAVECEFLAEVLESAPDPEEFRELINKLRRMSDRIIRTGR